jgi:lipid II:glycine glycyltransferase (peptidoglycan interpeptide bridge formation enzyme)
MFTTRIIDIKEKERYDSFVDAHPKGHFLQQWEWGQCKTWPWVGKSLPLIPEEDGEIIASMLS